MPVLVLVHYAGFGGATVGEDEEVCPFLRQGNA